MEISGMHFEYAGRNSREYGLIMANVETSRYTSVSGKVQTIKSYHKLDKKNYYIGTSTTDAPMVFDAEVVSCVPLSIETQREVKKWLFHRNGYKQLFMDMFDDYECETYELIDGEPKRTYLNCRFVNPEKLEYNGGVVGYKFTVECDSHLAWQEPITKVLNLSEASTPTFISVDVDTDSSDYIYPSVKITAGSSGGDISLINESDDGARITSFLDIPPYAAINMKPSIGFITDGYYDKFKDMNFLRLLDGENKIAVMGDVMEVQLIWQNMRYL